jgi:hypothetical protein
VHYDGWSDSRLRELFKVFGFKTDNTEQTAYLATRNITIIGHKAGKNYTKQQAIERARDYLSKFNVDDSDTENRLLDIWVKNFSRQLNKTFAK